MPLEKSTFENRKYLFWLKIHVFESNAYISSTTEFTRACNSSPSTYDQTPSLKPSRPVSSKLDITPRGFERWFFIRTLIGFDVLIDPGSASQSFPITHYGERYVMIEFDLIFRIISIGRSDRFVYTYIHRYTYIQRT